MGSKVTLDAFDHVGLVVKDVRAAAESWSAKIGIGDWRFTDYPNVKLAHAKIGPLQYELIEPVEGQKSLWADFLEARGEGLHHISYTVRDVDDTVAKLIEDGGRIVTDSLGQGISIGSNPTYMAYVEIGGPGSIILELLKTREPR
jgi:methylmalonyl-CoA/ethylmalonyl-CoA epimerase